MHRFRKSLFSLMEQDTTKASSIKPYDWFMIVVIVLSLFPLTAKETSPLLLFVEYVTFSVFSLDYFLRWLTADYLLKRGPWSFFLYPFTVMAIVDLLCVLPFVTLLNNSLKLLKIFRMIRSVRVLKVFRYSKNTHHLIQVLKKQKDSLLAVGLLALSYIVLSALILFNLEPDTFQHFFDALYWATISLTTVGYGDIYPTTIVGKAITMFSALLGVAIVAMPAGIITAGYMDEIAQEHQKE